MNAVQIRGKLIQYYGNKAGYIEKGRAVVDPLFKTEQIQAYLARQGLAPEWRDGVHEGLVKGNIDPESGGRLLKSCRIWQLKPDVDVMMKFIGYDELLERFGEPDPNNYRAVYDGEVENNNLDELFAKFNLDHPPGYEGHSLSMSDVVELYDSSGSTFHYVDRFGFKEISFQSQEQELYQGPEMSL